MKRSYFLIIFLLCRFEIIAQRPSTEHFRPYYPTTSAYSYLLIAPGTLGPNALPVPEVLDGNVGTDHHFQVSVINYRRDGGGDNGNTVHLNIRFPVVQNFMAFEIQWNVNEYFRATNEIRDILQIYKDDPGWSSEFGDIILNTYLQVKRETRFFPSLMVVSALKTTSGSAENGRYTDLPAHWHYLSFGKNLLSATPFLWRINGMAGIYIWQTNQADLEQNEGFLYGAENLVQYKKSGLLAGLSGYNGWKWYGFDRPLIFNAKFEYRHKQLSYFAEYKTGLRDYFYSSLCIGIRWHAASRFELKN